jgi:hypothetical protein
MTKQNQDRRFGLVMVPVCVFLFYQTFAFKKFDWDPLGMAFWPRIILVGLFIISVYYLIRGSVDNGPYEIIEPRAFLPWVGGVLYIILMPYLSFLIMTPIFLFIFVCCLGGWSRKVMIEATITAAATTLFIYLVFQKFLMVDLPAGFWG